MIRQASIVQMNIWTAVLGNCVFFCHVIDWLHGRYEKVSQSTQSFANSTLAERSPLSEVLHWSSMEIAECRTAGEEEGE